MDNNGQYVKKDDNDSKKIFTMLALVLTLMICTTGATYAFFAITAPTNSAIQGTAASASLTMTVTRIVPSSSKWSSSTQKMVPQYDKVGGTGAELLTTAMNTTNSCVDGNGNVVCQVYEIKLTNGGSSKLSVTGNITYTWAGGNHVFTNLKYRLKANETTQLTSTTAVNSSNLGGGTTTAVAKGTAISLANKKTLNAGGSYYWYIVNWINETGADQSATDKGNFTSTVTFNPVNPTTGATTQGVTSTIVATS